MIISIDEPAPIAVELPAEGNEFEIKFKPFRGLFDKANEPQLLLRELERLGTITVHCDTSAVPLLPDVDAGEPYLSWTVQMQTSASLQEVTEVFEFVEGDCSLAITGAGGAPKDELDIQAILEKVRGAATAMQGGEAAPSPNASEQAANAGPSAEQKAGADGGRVRRAPQ